MNIDFMIERLLLKVGNRSINIRDENHKKRGLTSVQAETMLFFEKHEGASIGQLKDHLQITHQAARNLVERIDKKDLLIIKVSQEDARCKNIFLSEKGKALCHELRKEGSFEGERLLKGFSEEEKTLLWNLLERMEKNVE